MGSGDGFRVGDRKVGHEAAELARNGEGADHNLQELGELIRDERIRRLGALERAAAAGDINHNTWRRIERGRSVRPISYSGIDRAFGVPEGSTLAAAASAEGRARLAREIAASAPELRDPLIDVLAELRDLRREVRELGAQVHELRAERGHSELEELVAVGPVPLIPERIRP